MVGVVLLRTRNLPGDENVAYWGLNGAAIDPGTPENGATVPPIVVFPNDLLRINSLPCGKENPLYIGG